MTTLSVTPYGDSALLVESTAATREERWAQVHAASGALRASACPGLEGVIASFDTMVVEFDPLVTDPEALTRRLLAIATDGGQAPPRRARLIEIPLLYGGEAGPDLADVARELGVGVDEFIDRHSAARWRVAFNGAPAGSPLHEGSPFERPIARRSHPRVRVPAGSAAVAGHQGTIYSIAAPGGWRLIGRTPLRILAPERPELVGIEPGDLLRFRPITPAEFDAAEPVFVGDLP